MMIPILWMVMMFVVPTTKGCTSIVVGPEASEDGRGWVGQSDDGEGAGDRRLVYVPPMDFPEGSMRPIIDYGDYPRYVGYERGVEAYYPSDVLPNRTRNVIGYVPQVRRTNGYYEANYAISNDHGVSFGESTCSARTFAKSVKEGGPSLLSMYSLSRLAAERADTARGAVEIMGAMAEKHGFYGDPAIDTGGESILVADGSEQFIFHVLAESQTTGGAIWCARRVPPDEVAIVSNAFVIGFVNASDKENFLFSDNMHAIALKQGWWDGKGMLHFTRSFSAGEYTSKFYSGRRMWAFWTALAPSLNVPSHYESYVMSIEDTYPVSAKPDHKVSRDNVLFDVYRNYYENTAFDLSASPASGPFGTPMRVKPGPAERRVAGTCGSKDDDGPCSHWERPIASFRSDTIYLTQFGRNATIWYLPGSALSGVFVPVQVSSASVPSALSTCANTFVDRTTLMWTFRELIQFAYSRWVHVKDDVRRVAKELESIGQRVVVDGTTAESHAREVRRRWHELYNELLVRYSDGWNYANGEAGRLGYPETWLETVGYDDNGVIACDPTCR